MNQGQKASVIDWTLFGLMSIFALLFVGYGITSLIKNNNMGFVLIVFGIISFLMLAADWRVFQGNIKRKNYWLLLHLQRMMAAYIASLTAFLVVNNTYLPGPIAWLLPTLIITPLIVKWSGQYAK